MVTATPMQEFRTPVLMVIFNRPDTTRQVFEAIRKVKPPRLYIAADGPRPHVPSDLAKCEETRKIADEVDWECEVKTLFRDTNLNCGVAPSSAFTWFFEHEEEGIILEDDCLPSQSFFWFCQELLERYRDDARVMHIGGNNFLHGWQHDHDYSYYFSRSGYIWGWATWRRSWELFDFDISLYQKLKNKGYFDGFFLNSLERFYRLRKFDLTVARRGTVDWWDYQWDFARFIHSGLAVVPQKNLVRNLGFGMDATHTTNGRSKSADMEALEITMPLKHPPFVVRDIVSDRKYFKNLIKDIVRSKIKV
ncbi:nucleotide-diphospho-sugar transferase [Fulvivirga sp. 29W222]|uniref:Nucleotide-diphospho-sugar transferase n=1 Tax=Fulvivirga marina TaxID=2494733 RepID=A0A937FXT6_9BACT|nr:nucleotide-diphospho-sugar transferase [Fulvivirga marina]MBL6448120.1 nucleotide-diphospho-sugar transferase [Fulvivirga marina]